ncbi:HAD family phosphatase [Hoeflea sp. WL0058]|uniref:HAD family phosphatase n=1 Tax=Flavimaribacter sediminis TaxID=2865987 RepID=A0AAE2ZSN0_9HYPH|nr:HAD family phosphatase [Flavimaribacter sediminis]MBW8640125.1 HAD family phosphatase [Flavimaribacter sediminis]
MNDPVRHIVFDIGKVLLHYDPHIPFSRIIPDETERQWFFDNVCTHDWNIEQDRGRSWEEAEAHLIAEHPDHEERIRAFRLNWHEMVPHAYDDSVDVMRSLMSNGYDVTMLTNFASDTFREAQERFTFLKEPRGVTVSGDIGLIKPDVAIYESHVENFDLDPANSLFIDDSHPNVEGARAAGWKAIHFKSAPDLLAELEKYGVKV